LFTASFTVAAPAATKLVGVSGRLEALATMVEDEKVKEVVKACE